MHEWSIADGIVNAITEYAKEHAIRKIKKVNLLVGELSILDTDILKEAINLLSKGTLLDGAKIVIETEHAKLKCLKCGYEWGFEEVWEQIKNGLKIEDLEGGSDPPIHYLPELVYAFAACPKCGSSDFDVVSGMGVKVKSIEV